MKLNNKENPTKMEFFSNFYQRIALNLFLSVKGALDNPVATLKVGEERKKRRGFLVTIKVEFSKAL